MKLIFFNQRKKGTNYNITTNFIIILLIILVGVVSFINPIASVNATTDKAIYQGNSENNNISLMINVYWGSEFIIPMLEILKANNVKATFFVGGSWVAQNNDLFDLIYKSNCEIGNHGYNHKDHAKISKTKNIEEITTTHTLVKNLSNYNMTLFAPPSGSYNTATLSVAEALGYKTIMWSKDTIDWRDKNAELIFSRATKNLQNGDLILMHPTEKTLEVFDRIVKEIKSQNFNLVTVSENIA